MRIYRHAPHRRNVPTHSRMSPQLHFLVLSSTAAAAAAAAGSARRRVFC
jgi:hypothetical protein